MCKELLALPKLYLFLDAVDLGSQPLDHPVHLGDFLLGVAEIIAMPAGCDLQLLILIESEQSESPCQTPGLGTLHVHSLALKATRRPNHSLIIHGLPCSVILVVFLRHTYLPGTCQALGVSRTASSDPCLQIIGEIDINEVLLNLQFQTGMNVP